MPAGTAGNSGTCTVSVVVTSATSGTYVNTIPAGGVSTSRGSNPQATNATLTVATVLGLTGSKSFSPSTMHVTGLSTLTITLNNPNIGALTNASFTDNLPVPLQIASPVQDRQAASVGRFDTHVPGGVSAKTDGTPPGDLLSGNYQVRSARLSGS